MDMNEKTKKLIKEWLYLFLLKEDELSGDFNVISHTKGLRISWKRSKIVKEKYIKVCYFSWKCSHSELFIEITELKQYKRNKILNRLGI